MIGLKSGVTDTGFSKRMNMDQVCKHYPGYILLDFLNGLYVWTFYIYMCLRH